jgi:hypothetical protein
VGPNGHNPVHRVDQFGYRTTANKVAVHPRSTARFDPRSRSRQAASTRSEAATGDHCLSVCPSRGVAAPKDPAPATLSWFDFTAVTTPGE